MKKIVLLTSLLLALAIQGQAHAASCPESSVAEEAMEKRMNEITGIYDSVVGKSSDSRNSANCLSAVEDLGKIFSMGVSLPSTTSLFNKICNEIDTQLDKVVDNAKNQIMDSTKDMIDDNPVFSVVLEPNTVVNDLVGKLK